MSFEQNLAGKTEHCEKVLIDMLPSVEGLEGTDRYASVVVDAMQYSVMAGGKRLRPLFIYETCRMYGGREELAAPFMAALEMIHNYSLVHDDMPAMDNDEYRRGRKTTWVVYGEGIAILAGDALLNYAYETAVKAFDVCNDAKETAGVISACSKCLFNLISLGKYENLYCLSCSMRKYNSTTNLLVCVTSINTKL